MIDLTGVAGEHVGEQAEVHDAHQHVEVEAYLVQPAGDTVEPLVLLLLLLHTLQEVHHLLELQPVP